MAYAFLVYKLVTNVYIDGFNLYFAIKRTNYKWLDLSALCTRLLPGKNINKIFYFTAIVKARTHDPNAPVRQGIYLRALRTIPNLKIHDEGHFVDRKRLLPQYPYAYQQLNPTKPPQSVQVMKTEEKGSDVNLASRLLVDCFSNAFNDAVVISNDADLTMPIRLVTQQYGKDVMTINPNRRRYLSRQLIGVATSYLPTINMGVYSSCQFPSTLTDSNGQFSKPLAWDNS